MNKRRRGKALKKFKLLHTDVLDALAGRKVKKRPMLTPSEKQFAKKHSPN